MSRVKYFYNAETCKYERVKSKKSEMVYAIIGLSALSLLFAFGLTLLYHEFYQSEVELENEELKVYYELINKDLGDLNQTLDALQKRDDNIYRVIFQAEPVAATIRESGAGGSNKFDNINKKGLKNETLIVDAFKKIDKIKRKMYIQSKSYDEVSKMAQNKEKMLAHIPAIQPISNKELTRLSSGFGIRLHPFYNIPHMHSGIDFVAKIGTPVYATANGTVKIVRKNLGGYGKEIQIDHGYGYVTLYAHLSDFNVQPGQKIKRGECIGFVGSTGMSSGPHLHYEVIKSGKKVNPVYYFFNDLSPDEYEKILQLASIQNQSM